MIGTKISARELQLGDTVVLESNRGGWNTCLVTGVSDEVIELFRPYGHLADFSYSWSKGGANGEQVHSDIGSETWKECRQDSHQRFTLVNRKAIR